MKWNLIELASDKAFDEEIELSLAFKKGIGEAFESGEYINRIKPIEHEENLKNFRGDTIHITVNGARYEDSDAIAQMIAEKIEMKRKRREVSDGEFIF